MQLDINDEYPELICPKCEKNMQLAAKIRKDLLKVDRFWRTFLTNHSKYNPMPLDQLAPIESPSHVDNSSYLKRNQIVPVSQNDIGVQTFEIATLSEKSKSANGFLTHELNGLAIEEVKIESYEVYESVKCEFDDDNVEYGDGNDLPIDSDGEEMDEDSKDLTINVDDDKNENVVDACMKRRSGRKYPKKRNIHGTDPVKGDEKLFKCLDHECRQGKYGNLLVLFSRELSQLNFGNVKSTFANDV